MYVTILAFQRSELNQYSTFHPGCPEGCHQKHRTPRPEESKILPTGSMTLPYCLVKIAALRDISADLHLAKAAVVNMQQEAEDAVHEDEGDKGTQQLIMSGEQHQSEISHQD